METNTPRGTSKIKICHIANNGSAIRLLLLPQLKFLIKEGYDLPSYDVFERDMRDPVKSKTLHDNLVKENYDIPDYETFANDMGLKKKDIHWIRTASIQLMGDPA